MSRMRLLILADFVAVLLSYSFVTQAQIRYEATLDASAKKLWSQESSKIRCSLIGDIPEYGFVEFQSLSGRKTKTSMAVHPKLGIVENSKMRFISMRPEWQSGGKEELLGQIKLYQSYDAWAGPTLAWKVMNALARGKQIFMPYTSNTFAPGQNIVPSLSPLGFKEQYSKFLNCQQNLLKVSYADVQLLPLVFKFQKSDLTARSEDSLKAQLEYIAQDKSVNHVIIRVFSYDMKTHDDCLSMVKERGDALKKFYIDAGFKEDQIEMIPFNVMTVQSMNDENDPDTSPQSRNAIVELSRDETSKSRLDEVELPDVGANSGE